MRRMRCVLGAVLLSLFICSCAFSEAGFLYRVSGGKNDMYLFGSIHIGIREMYPFSEKVQNAMDEAQTFVFECDTQGDEQKSLIRDMMYFANGDALEKHVSAETLNYMIRAAQILNYDPDILSRMKVWVVADLFSTDAASFEMGRNGTDAVSELGVEQQVRIAANNRPVLWLETAHEQMEIMNTFSDTLQEYLLRDACLSVLDPSEASSDAGRWPEWWLRGEEEPFRTAFGRELENSPSEAEEYYQKLLFSRNKTMADRLETYMEDHGVCFVTVGLLHLVLDNSILSELMQKGYTVQKIQ